jgi:hypothetical protein
MMLLLLHYKSVASCKLLLCERYDIYISACVRAAEEWVVTLHADKKARKSTTATFLCSLASVSVVASDHGFGYGFASSSHGLRLASYHGFSRD